MSLPPEHEREQVIPPTPPVLHKHICRIHGVWWHGFSECVDPPECPCPDEYGEAFNVAWEGVRRP